MKAFDDTIDEQIVIIKEFIRDKVDKTGAKGVVLGLSGGLDSAVILKLCLDALSPKQVYCLIMPESATPDKDTEDAKWLAEKWDVPYEVIDINNILESFAADADDKIAIANLKARIRMCLEYYHANVKNFLVVGTSNKSELLTGYTTKYGDSAADFLPIGDIFKSDLDALAEHIDVPERFRQKPPRAGLWEGQTDEKELGYGYEELDSVLKGLESLASVEEIAKRTGMAEEDIHKIKEMVVKSAHKRKIPPVLKLRKRTVGLDWREFSH